VKRKLGLAATAGALAVALTLGLTACGGSGDSTGVASLTDTSGQSATDGDGAATTAEQDPQEAALAFARCMREHGVDMPDPSANGGIQLNVGPDGDPEKVEEAQQACDHFLQNAGPQLSEEQQSAIQDAALAFAKCMREHGIDMPDPQFEGGRMTLQGGPENGMDPDDPKFQEAQEACQPIMDEAAREAGIPEPGEGPEVQRSGGGS